MANNTAETLEKVRMLSLTGEYSEALQIINTLLVDLPLNIQALRLKGNIIELWLFSGYETFSAKELESYFATARECYEKILAIDKDNSYAMKDLADNLKEIGANTEAKKLYLQLIGCLNQKIADGQDISGEFAEELADTLEEYSLLVEQAS